MIQSTREMANRSHVRELRGTGKISRQINGILALKRTHVGLKVISNDTIR